MPEETLEATVSSVKWARPGNAWKLLLMSDGTTWKGKVGDVTPGTLLRATGEWVTDKWGTAFDVRELKLAPIARDAAGQEAWLCYRLPQIGPERAKELIKLFGASLWEIIEHEPKKLKQIKGLTGERIRELQEQYQIYKEERAIVEGLVDAGLPTALAVDAYRTHGSGLEALLADDPYALLDLEGCSFEILDPVVLELGVKPTADCRIRAAARVALERDLAQGHCYSLLYPLAANLSAWGLPIGAIKRIWTEAPLLTIRGNGLLLRWVDAAEQAVAQRVVDLTFTRQENLELPDWLDEGQKAAVAGLLEAPLAILTGGPGTGKTTVLKTVLDQLEARGDRVVCASPTGKAARRLSEVTGRPASTVHKTLEWCPDGWRRHATNPLDGNVVVIDEASMLDILLAAGVFEALGKARLILVGDVDQLPPVGPGQPLYDLIQSGKVPVFRLTEVHRQKGDSWVCDNAYRIIDGQNPNLANTTDFLFESTDKIAEAVVRLYRKHPDAQVLTPEHKNGAGTVLLNHAVQDKLNPKDKWEACVESNGYRIFEGDKVLYTKNNPDLDLVNGDIGVVKDIRTQDDSIIVFVLFDGRHNDDHELGWYKLEGSQARPLTLAYAMTVHKCVAPDTIFCTQKQGLITLEQLKQTEDRGHIVTAEGLLPFHSPFIYKEKENCIRIAAKEGYEITVSENHRLMTWTGRRYELVEARELQKGQFLRLKLRWKEGRRGPGILPSLPKAPPSNIRAKKHVVPMHMYPPTAEFFGLMVADGTVYKKGFRLAKRHKDVVDRFCYLCERLFHVEPRRFFTNNAYHAEVNSTALAGWLKAVGGLEPNRKAIPEAVLQSRAFTVSCFLRGLFEDGTVNIHKKTGNLDHIAWSTKYEKMAQQVQIILLRFGVISSRKKRNEKWVLYVYGENAKRYVASGIGFISKFKNDRLRLPAGKETQYLIPIPREDFSWAGSTGTNAKNRGYISRETARKLGKQEELEFHHSPIVKLEKVKSRVGCLTVPNHGRFLQNGFDGGNSQGSEWPYVVVVADDAHWSFRRQLLYTAVTRTYGQLAIVGSAEAIEKAVKKPRDNQRRTMLQERLKEE